MLARMDATSPPLLASAEHLPGVNFDPYVAQVRKFLKHPAKLDWAVPQINKLERARVKSARLAARPAAVVASEPPSESYAAVD